VRLLSPANEPVEAFGRELVGAPRVHHDEDAEIYINGQLVLTLPGFTNDYVAIPLNEKAKAALKSGVNTFAVYRNTTTAKTVTLVLGHLTDVSGRALADKTYALAAPGEVWIPLKKEYANDAQNGVGRAKITIDTNTTALVSVVQTG